MLQRIDYDRVKWEVAQCSMEGCYNDAELIWQEYYLYCIECADKLFERALIKEDKELQKVFSKMKLPRIGEWYDGKE